MQQLISRWIRSALIPSRRQRSVAKPTALSVERFEDRTMLDVTLSSIVASELAAGKELYIPLTAVDDDQNAVSFTVDSDDPTVTAEVVTGGRTLVINVSGVDSTGAAFTGDLSLRLFEDLAPETTARIIQLALSGFYEDVIFHRVVDGFVAQGGDPTGTGSGGSGVEFDDELTTQTTFGSNGLLAMANSGDDTNDSQFFIVDIGLTLAQLPQHLNFNHTIFGILTSGFDTFQQVMTTPTTSTRPNDDVVINSISVIDDTQNGVLRISAPEGFDGSATITATADNGMGDTDVQSFMVNVLPDAVNDRAFLGEVTDLTTNEDTPVTFTVTGIDLENDELTYVVRDPASFASPTSTGTVPDNITVDITVTQGEVDGAAFVAALDAAGVKFFGSVTCPFCEEQKALFGEGAFGDDGTDGPFIECLDDTGALNGVCTAEGIGTFPTWEFPDGTRLTGVQSLELLAVRAGVELPRTITTAEITLTPDEDFNGTIDMIVGVRDQTARGNVALNGRANYDTQRITLMVNAVNDRPTAGNLSISTDENTAVNVSLGNDDGDDELSQGLTFEIVDQPMNGTISSFNTATGALTYTPNTDFRGTETFTYRVMDDGGTANGGSDTSEVSTVTISVGRSAPTGIDLSPESDDGQSTSDNFTSDSTPTFTVQADPGMTVEFLVNGTDTVTASETSAGVYTATLMRNNLRVGANSLLATATDSTGSSDPSEPLTFIYAPSFANVYTVPGDVGSSQTLNVEWTKRQAAYDNEIGIFPIDDLDGSIGDLSPGDPGYAAAALGQAGRQVLFASGSSAGATATVTAEGGDLFAFYMIANNSTSDFLSSNADNGRSGVHAYFSVDDANPDGLDHVRTVEDALTGSVLMHWEDMYGGGDRDFNDAVITVTTTANAGIAVGEALRVPGGDDTDVSATFTIEPTQQASGSSDTPAGFAKGEFGTFVVDDARGTVDGVEPGEAGYLQAIVDSGTAQTLFDDGDAIGTDITADLPGGALVGFYYTPGSTLADVLADNADNDSSAGAVALFSFDAGNPGEVEHFRWFGPEGNASTTPPFEPGGRLELHVLDRLFGGDDDFDDLLISIGY